MESGGATLLVGTWQREKQEWFGFTERYSKNRSKSSVSEVD